MPSLLIPCSRHSCTERTSVVEHTGLLLAWQEQGGQEPSWYLLPELSAYLVAALAYLKANNFAGHVN
jgi:hypothetical protein